MREVRARKVRREEVEEAIGKVNRLVDSLPDGSLRTVCEGIRLFVERYLKEEGQGWRSAVYVSRTLPKFIDAATGVGALPDGPVKIECQKVLSTIEDHARQEDWRKVSNSTQRLLNYLDHLKNEGLDQPDPLYQEAMEEIGEAWKMLNALPDYLKSQYREEEDGLRHLEALAKKNPQVARRACEKLIKALAVVDVPR